MDSWGLKVTGPLNPMPTGLKPDSLWHKAQLAEKEQNGRPALTSVCADVIILFTAPALTLIISRHVGLQLLCYKYLNTCTENNANV